MSETKSQTSSSLLRWLLLACLAFALPLATGCQGCRNDQAEDDATAGQGSEDSEEPAEPFDFEKLAALPDLEDPANQAKPGHWVAGHRQITANDYDFQGSLENRVIDGNGNPIPTELTDHFLTTERPISLPRGTTKDVEVMYYIPRRLLGENVIVTLDQQLFDRGGRKVEVPNGAVNLMPEYRFFFIVLSNRPGGYSYVKTLTSMNVSGGMGRMELFRVVVPTITSYVPLPSDSSAWTSFAFLLWDNLDPVQLDPSQQQAMLDWLHFGGQLIVSGPEAVDKLSTSFLAEYLPATSAGARELTGEDVSDFSEFWSVKSLKGDTQGWQVTDKNKVLGTELRLGTHGQWLDHSEGLVAESGVGRGRIVMTAFPLSHRSLLAWPSFDSFFHNGLMRRPQREFRDDSLNFDANVPFFFREYSGNELDPRLSSTLRYISRDLGFASAVEEAEQLNLESGENRDPARELPVPASSSSPQQPSTGVQATPVVKPDQLAVLDQWHFGGYRKSTLSGVAGWNDTSPIAKESRSVLDSSAGISPPSSKFVLGALVVYLVVLVPVNWIFFRLIGRVEWAWIAAPVLAIIAAVGVVRMAHLDIGFARSQTELTIVELQPNYQRGHVTRYSSLYTSLSTEFDVDFSSDDARGQPWGSPMANRMRNSIPDREVRLSQSGGLKLTDVQVSSNSAEMLHLEQMVDFGGPIVLFDDSESAPAVENRSSLNLRDVGILGHAENGKLLKGWIGDLTAGQRVDLQWDSSSTTGLTFEAWEENPITRTSSQKEITRWLENLDGNADQQLSLKELREDAQYTSDWRQWFNDADKPTEEEEADPTLVRKLDRDELMRFRRNFPMENLWLGGLIKLLGEQLVRKQGGMILVGWSEEPVAGANLRPVPSQVDRRTLVVVHLKTPRWNPASPDTNLYRDVAQADFEPPIPGVDGGEEESP